MSDKVWIRVARPAAAGEARARSGPAFSRCPPMRTALHARLGRQRGPAPPRAGVEGQNARSCAFQTAAEGHRDRAMSDSNDEQDKASEGRRNKLVKAGVAVGIGSAAIVAALLYASKVKKKPRR